ncbi:MAG TPA: phosphate transporter [Microscillaceae bacterium]|nr:phosphate transporter [Microscillaceae bacterium]
MAKNRRGNISLLIVQLLFLVLAFMLALQLLILAFDQMGQEQVRQIFAATSNPFIGLFIGLLATAIIQSSSTITTLTVAAVAANTLTLDSAVFIIMGANIGTTVTSTLVSVSHVSQRKEFRKAIAAGTLHDFFNIFTALILFPLEYYFRVLSSLARYFSQLIYGDSVTTIHSIPNPLGKLFFPLTDFLHHTLGGNSTVTLILAAIILFITIRSIALLLKPKWDEGLKRGIEKNFFGRPFRALLSGTIITGVMQSSSVVSSLVVPMVASNKLSVRRVFPFIMGTNLGTTFTALFAALSKSEAALSIALTHILFNLIGVLIFYPIPAIRNIPVWFARRLGKATLRNRLYGFIYLLFTFFVIPFFLIYFSQKTTKKQNYNNPTLERPTIGILEKNWEEETYDIKKRNDY